MREFAPASLYPPQLSELLWAGQGVTSEALGQAWIPAAAVVLVLATVYERTTARYGKRGERYVLTDVGHAAENVCLQAVALGPGTCVVGAMEDPRVRRLLELPSAERPIVLLPIGRRAGCPVR